MCFIQIADDGEFLIGDFAIINIILKEVLMYRHLLTHFIILKLSCFQFTSIDCHKMSTSKIQSSAEQYLMLSGILSTVVCPILIVFILSLIIPETFGELSLFDNSKYFESEIIAQLR